MDRAEEITLLLERGNQGDAGARERVLELLYDELHRMANRHAWKGGETLRPTALINEAFIKLFKNNKRFENRENLFACAALAMRQLILNNAEKARAQKRGGGQAQLTLQEWDGPTDLNTNVVALNEALEKLERVHPRHAQILGLCYFAGFKTREIASFLELSESTVTKDLRFAKVWVRKKMQDAGESRPSKLDGNRETVTGA